MVEKLSIVGREEGDIVVVTLNGELNFTSAPDLEEVIKKCMEKKRYRVLLEMNGVPFVDSRGMGALIGSSMKLKSKKGRLVLAALAPTVRQALKQARLDRTLDIQNDPAKALEELSGPE